MDRRAFRVDPELLKFARDMRAEPAPAEEKLWWCVRNRRLEGLKFRRQVGIDRYIVDFLCPELRLVVELDGPSHFVEGAADDDAERTARLEDAGYRVVRYTNTDIHENLDGLLGDLLRTCEKLSNSTFGPSPLPSPPSTGERE